MESGWEYRTGLVNGITLWLPCIGLLMPTTRIWAVAYTCMSSPCKLKYDSETWSQFLALLCFQLSQTLDLILCQFCTATRQLMPVHTITASLQCRSHTALQVLGQIQRFYTGGYWAEAWWGAPKPVPVWDLGLFPEFFLYFDVQICIVQCILQPWRTWY